MNPGSFDPAICNEAKALPSGLSAFASVIIAWALIIPSIGSHWYTGPIIAKAGNLGFEYAVVVAVLAYLPIRTAEIKYRGLF
jgi:hypothetical protein